MIDPINILKSDCAEAFAENDRLRALNAELLEALQYIAEHDPDKPGLHGEMIDVLRSAIAAARVAIAKASADNGAVSE